MKFNTEDDLSWQYNHSSTTDEHEEIESEGTFNYYITMYIRSDRYLTSDNVTSFRIEP